MYFKCVKLLVIKKLSHAFEGLSLSSFHLQNKIFQTPAKRFGHSTRLVLFKHLNEKITFGTVILYYVPMTRQINIEDDLTQWKRVKKRRNQQNRKNSVCSFLNSNSNSFEAYNAQSALQSSLAFDWIHISIGTAIGSVCNMRSCISSVWLIDYFYFV